MGSSDKGRCVFTLTSLQIGDLQSYLSDLSVFLAPESKRFYILVDNRPWLKDLVSTRPAHLWQLMVTKSRLSPFANTRVQRGRKETGEFSELKPTSKSEVTKLKKLQRWLSLIDATTLSQKRLPVNKLRTSLALNSKLHRTLYGFIIFEVAWADVRGINYLNELQTDTSLAIESKFMRKWEFESIEQAAECISSWFTGTQNEQLLLKEHLDSEIGDIFLDAEEDFSSLCTKDEKACNADMCVEDESPCCLKRGFNLYHANMEAGMNILHTPQPPNGPHRRRKITPVSSVSEVDINSKETHDQIVGLPVHSENSCTSYGEEDAEATHYRDVLLLCRFNDRDLPFKLKEIIMSDLRLLTLLESGLPSWVLFLQSYPVFCHIYRPWMRPLARALYLMISIITVLIGFYDLYKNVPVLKATAARLCGPLFDWIETWEMITRIRYLGTMLFLHNFQKAIKWLLMITRTARSFLEVVIRPMADPLADLFAFFIPLWNLCLQVGGSFCSIVWAVMMVLFNLLEDLVEIVLFPMWFVLSISWTIAICIMYPIYWMLREVLYTPIRLVLGLGSLVTFIFNCTCEMASNAWPFVGGIFQFTSSAEATVSTFEVSMWHSLWNDLFSQVFRAVRSILYGFVAAFTTCNRHRLSIYNHVLEFIQRLSDRTKRSQFVESNHGGLFLGSQNLNKRKASKRIKPQKQK